MVTFPPSFIDLVESSLARTKNYYQNEKIICNPWYLGFGNPDAEILIIGQEKAIPAEDNHRIRAESIDNPMQWDRLQKENIKDPFFKFSNTIDFLNPYQPYRNRAKGNGRGQTWFYYQKLLQSMYPEIDQSRIENSFFEKAFITELNHQTSTSKRGYQPNAEREILWESEFFKGFPIILLAVGNYLSQNKVEELFGVKKISDVSQPYQKLITYESSTRKIIHTRQLSNGVSDSLLDRIVREINNAS